MARVLIIGSLEAELGTAARIAQARGARLILADGAATGLDRLRADGADLALCDVAHDVGWLVAQLAMERIACPVVACGRPNDAEAAVRAIRAGAKDFLPLPPDADLIAAMLQAVAGDPEKPVVRDDAMRLFAGARRTGGARRCLGADRRRKRHRQGGAGAPYPCRLAPRTRAFRGAQLRGACPRRCWSPNCSATRRAPSSGAVASRKGKFEQAEGGTLLLDEIGEMDLRLQAKLLRALQEREIDRLGGGAPVKVDVRILAASHRDLATEVAAGRFREDLYFRLAVVRLRIPPLRERRADILALAHHFAQRYARANGLPERGLLPTTEALLLAHPWPGNVRELENTLHRAVLLAEGPAIGPEAIDLLEAMPRTPQPAPAATAEPTRQPPVTALVGRRMEEVERDLIIETLSHCLGNRTRAAEMLGISIRTLRNKLHEYRAAGVPVPPVPGQPPYGLAAG